MTYRTQAEALEAHSVVADFITRSNAGAPQLQTGMSPQTLAEDEFLSVTVDDDDYFSALSLQISYSFLWDGAALPNWIAVTQPQPGRQVVSGRAPSGSAGGHTLRRIASVTTSGQTFTTHDDAAVTITGSNLAPIKIADFADKAIATLTAGSFDIPAGQLFSDTDPLTFSLQGLDGAALPAGVTYSSPSADILRLSFASQASPGSSNVIEIVASDGTLQTVSRFELIFDDAPSGQFDFTVSVDNEVYLDISGRSDDPVNNTIVPGTVIVESGSVREAQDGKGVFYTRDPAVEGAQAITFTLIDQNQLTSDLSGAIDNVVTQDIVSSPIQFSRTQGASTTIDLKNYFSGGHGGIDPAGFFFVDAQGNNLGKTGPTTSEWSPVISNVGILTFNFAAGFVGQAPALYVGATDRAGAQSAENEFLNVFTNAASGQQPFPTPGVAGTGPTVCFNMEYLKGYIGARQLANVAKELFIVSNIGDGVTTPSQRIAAGTLNQSTGIIQLSPSDNNITLGQIRWAARNAYGNRPDLDTGIWSILANMTGTVTLECPQYPFSQISAGRWERNFTASDTGPAQIVLKPGASGGTIDVSSLYIGLKSEEGTLWKEGPGEYLDLISMGHCLRVLDGGHGYSTSKVVRASDVARGIDAIWGNPNFNTGLRNIPASAFFELAMKAEVGIWWPCPWALGAQSIEQELYSGGGNVFEPAAQANAGQILADMQVEDLAYANYIVDEMELVGFPEHLLFRASCGNEVFNFAGAFWPHARYSRGLGAGIRALWNSSVNNNNLHGYANGIHAASLAKAFDTVFKARRPNQHWTMSIDVHTAGGGALTQRAMAGVVEYNARYNSPVPITKFRGAKTNYTSGGLKYRGSGNANPLGAASKTAYYDQFLTDFQADATTLFNTVRDWMKGGSGNFRDNNTRVIQYHNVHKSIFAQFGTIMDADYEGSSGDDMPASERSRLPGLHAAAVQYLRSTQNGEQYADLFARTLAISPDHMITDYGMFYPGPGLPWNTLYPGEDFTQAYYAASFAPYLRLPLSQRP